jgi:hypothetical protein
MAMSLLGHSRHSDLQPRTSGLPGSTDIVSIDRHVLNVPKHTRSRKRMEAKKVGQAKPRQGLEPAPPVAPMREP